MTDIATLDPQAFEAGIGQTATVATQLGPVALRVESVKLLSEQSIRDLPVEIDGRLLPPRRAFSVALAGPLEPLLGQGSYEIDLPGLGRLVLFLKPYAQVGGQTLYEIPFS